MTTPFPYQHEGISFLASRRAAMLADSPGLGKSLQAIRACDAIIALKVLIICPASVVGNWRAEIAKYREGIWDFHVTSYERAAGREHATLMKKSWDVLIIDEAHYLKTVSTQRTKAIYGFTGKSGSRRKIGLIDRADYVWLLTGTPMPNNPSELYSHLRALREDLLVGAAGFPWTLHQFIQGYCQTKSNGFGMKIVGAKNEQKLHDKLDGFMLRRRKHDVLKDLPPLRFGEVAVEGDLSALPAEEVEIVQRALEKGGFDALRDVAQHVGTLRRLTGMAKLPSTIAWLKDWLANSGDQKIVVFAYHKDVIGGLREAFADDCVVIDGSKTQVERTAAVTAFQCGKPRVFIGQIQAAGTGITLTAASDLLFVEGSWIPADLQQAAQRIHRISQTEPCLVRFALIPGSIDEDMQRAVMAKTRMIEAVIEGEN